MLHRRAGHGDPFAEEQTVNREVKTLDEVGYDDVDGVEANGAIRVQVDCRCVVTDCSRTVDRNRRKSLLIVQAHRNRENVDPLTVADKLGAVLRYPIQRIKITFIPIDW